MKHCLKWGLVVALAVAVTPVDAFAASPLLKQIEEEFIALSAQVRPAVVEIEVTGKKLESIPGLEDMFRRQFGPEDEDSPPNIQDFFRRLLPNQDDEETPDESPESLEERQREFLREMPAPRSTGSGFIYSENGFIVTNNHVVDGAETIKVTLSDGRRFDAEVQGTDPDTDIAVIKVDTDQPLPVMKLGDSDGLRIGQFAVAMGSPSGLQSSFSYGHISGLGRESLGLDRELRFRGFIQTDAAINLGNSGGPLCNIDGEAIGINIAIVYGANSLGFAIPINRAKEIVPQLIDAGHVLRAYLGVRIVDIAVVAEEAGVPNPDEFAAALGLPDRRGAYVRMEPLDETPADVAGLTTDDVIRSIDGVVLDDANDLVQRVSAMKPGRIIDMEVWRDGEKMALQAELAEWQGMRRAELGTPVLGMFVMELSPDMAKHISPDEKLKGGVIVGEVDDEGPAAGKIEPGDIIVKVAHEDITDISTLRDQVRQNAKSGKILLFKVVRPGRGEIPVGIKVPE